MNKDLEHLIELLCMSDYHYGLEEEKEFELLRKKLHKELEEWNSVQQRIKTYGEVYLMDNVSNVNYGVRQKHQENQDIVNKLREFNWNCVMGLVMKQTRGKMNPKEAEIVINIAKQELEKIMKNNSDIEIDIKKTSWM